MKRTILLLPLLLFGLGAIADDFDSATDDLDNEADELQSVTGNFGYTAPDSGYTYDWRSGNSYTWSHGYDGTINVRGYNLNTGGMWNTTIEPNGSMHGFDSNTNYWTYDSRTGTYMNMGTGTICTGKGYARVCN
jgi:hypothetical protein